MTKIKNQSKVFKEYFDGKLDPTPEDNIKGENFFALLSLDSLKNDFNLNYDWLKRLFKGPFDVSEPTSIQLVKTAEGSLVQLKDHVEDLLTFVKAYEYTPPAEDVEDE